MGETEVISFDVDGTLVKKDLVEKFWFREIPAMVAEKKRVDFSVAQREVKESYREIGDDELEWYLPEYWFSRFGLNEKPENVLRKIRDDFPFYSDALETLNKLEDRYKLIVISNASREFLRVNLKELKDRFDLVCSCVSDLEEIKKNPKVFQTVSNKLGVEPEKIVHVGDDWEADFIAPKQSGIRSFFLDRKGDKKHEDSKVLESLSHLPHLIRNE